MAIIVTTKDDAMEDLKEIMKYHEDRWNARIRAHGADQLITSHYTKYTKDVDTKEDKEHSILELAAACMHLYKEMREDD